MHHLINKLTTIKQTEHTIYDIIKEVQVVHSVNWFISQ